MPEEIELADGTTRVVPTEEEYKNLQKGHDANKEKKEVLGKLYEALELSEGEKLEDKIQELKESANPNWPKFRSTFNNMKKELKDKGVDIDEETGEIKSNKNGLNQEEIQKMINDGIQNGIKEYSSKSAIDNALSKYSDDDRSKIQPVFDRLMQIGGSTEENLALAEAKIFPDRNINNVKNVFNSASGHGAPMGQENGNSFDKTNEGQSAASAMNLSFSKKDNK